MNSRLLSRRSALRGAAVFAAGMSALACTRTSSRDSNRSEVAFEPPIRGGTLILTATGPPEHLDPHGWINPLTQRLAAFSYNRLFKIRAGGGSKVGLFEPVEDLAESSESLPDSSMHTVQLRRDAHFSGRAGFTRRSITAQDVVMSFDRFRSAAGKDSGLSAVIERMSVVDERTVRFELKRPAASFLEMLASPIGLWVLPVPEILEGVVDPDRAPNGVASGPFTLESIDAENITLRRNADYFLPEAPFLDGIDIAVEREYVRSKVRFRDGNLDVLRPFAIDVPDLRQSTPGVRFFGDIPLGMNGIYFEGRLFKDVRVRRAVSMAIERAALIETYASVSQLKGLGAEERLHNAGVPASFSRWWLDPTSPEMGKASQWYDYNPKEAIALLSAAGVAPGSDIAFRYQASGSASAFSSIAQSIALMFNEIGLHIRMYREEPMSNLFPNSTSTRTDGIIFSATAPHTDIDDWLISTLHSSGGRNMTSPVDKQLDKLIQDQQAASTLEARLPLIHEIQRYASDRMYMVPTAAGSSWTAVQPRVRNYEVYQANSGNYGQAAEQWQWLHVNS